MAGVPVSDGMAGVWPDDVPWDQEFERLFREHYPMVYRTAYGVLGRSHDADDVAQTVFLRISTGVSKGRVLPNPGAYLYRAAVNESLNVVRTRARNREGMAAAQYESLRAASPPAAAADDLHTHLYEAVATLRPRAAEIVILKYVHGCSDGEIATRLGTSRGTIAVSLYRSRARLRHVLRSKDRGGRS